MSRYLLIVVCILAGAVVGYIAAFEMIFDGSGSGYDHGSELEQTLVVTVPIGALVGAGIAFSFLSKNVIEE